ncbi:hypothetical protein [Roseovarius autotrophicus]|uniref:hypothetical protein n=1 Tax=Roseovarius autotrophicus TaxID=2824121 RepID=UPI001B38D133|nr:hypothetical protein [Roseovarius autotrophicus]
MRDDRQTPCAASQVETRGDRLPAGPPESAWSDGDLDGLGRVMSRRETDLSTAVCVFFQGEPERFNYLPKRDVPAAFHGIVRLLDNICMRVNSGFYLPHPERPLFCRATLGTWLDNQHADAAQGRRGRWTLDERVLAAILDPSRCVALETICPRPAATGLWRALLAPLRRLGVDRDILKYRGRDSNQP